MIIKEIELVNYGAYAGRNRLDLSCTQERPIVLISGTNGAGKTTLFESVMLCLYGAASLDGRPSKSDYAVHLAKKVHRRDGMVGHGGTSISVTFQMSRGGKITECVVSRSWGMHGESETLAVREIDGKSPANTNMDKRGWQAVIDGLVPIGIAKMFFFDGERIDRMIKDEKSETIKPSCDTLLGLDIVNRLRRDLEVSTIRAMKKDGAGAEEELGRLTKEKRTAEKQIEALMKRRVSKKAELDDARRVAAGIDDEINSLGGVFVARRAEIKAKLEIAIKSHGAVSARIEKMCSGALPFAVIPNEMAEIKAQIHKDRDVDMQKHGTAAVEKAVEQMKLRLNEESVWEGIEDGAAIRAKLTPRIIMMLESTKLKPRGMRMFDLSHEQEERVLDTIHKARGPIVNELKHATTKLKEVEGEIQNLEKVLASTPDDDEIAPHIGRLKKVQVDIGSIGAEIDHIDVDVSALHTLLDRIQAKMRGVLEKIYKTKSMAIKVKLAKDVQRALEEYGDRLACKKIALLESNLQVSICELMHKKGWIKRVSVDQKTYAMTLYGKGGDIIPKDTLSKGEQQMLTIAVLWSLARTSSRPLPYMIDTPLSRLDVKHRNSLIERFFPVASHQMIIFSTDAEVGSSNYRQLEQYVSRTYVLRHDGSKGRTSICQERLDVS